MEESGKVNVYKCRDCGNKMTTKNIDSGTTPFIIGCDAELCDGMAESSFYRVPQHLTPDYHWMKLDDEVIMERAKENAEEAKVKNPEWYKGVKEDLGKDPVQFLFEQSKEHADNGGLFKVKNEDKVLDDKWRQALKIPSTKEQDEAVTSLIEELKEVFNQDAFEKIMEEWIPRGEIEKGLVSELELELLQDFVMFLDSSYHPPIKK